MISNILLILVGCTLIVFREKFAHGSLEFQKKAFKIKYGQKEERSMKILTVAVGVAFLFMPLVK